MSIFLKNIWIDINYIFEIRQYFLSINKFWYVFRWNIPMYEFEFRFFWSYGSNFSNLSFWSHATIQNLLCNILYTTHMIITPSGPQKICIEFLQPANNFLWSSNINVRSYIKLSCIKYLCVICNNYLFESTLSVC